MNEPLIIIDHALITYHALPIYILSSINDDNTIAGGICIYQNLLHASIYCTLYIQQSCSVTRLSKY